MKINLDECPFCGGHARISGFTTDDYEMKFYVCCEDCGTHSQFFDSLTECENGWNSRVISEKKAKQIHERYCKYEPCEHCEDCGRGEDDPDFADIEHGFMPHPESEYAREPF